MQFNLKAPELAGVWDENECAKPIDIKTVDFALRSFIVAAILGAAPGEIPPPPQPPAPVPAVNVPILITSSVVNLHGTAVARGRVNIYDNDKLVGSVIATSTGSWSKSLTPLAKGPHVIQIEAVDSKGNVSAKNRVATLQITG